MAQPPLAGHHLRYLIPLPCIASDPERIGDEAEDIAQMVLHIVEFFP